VDRSYVSENKQNHDERLTLRFLHFLILTPSCSWASPSADNSKTLRMILVMAFRNYRAVSTLISVTAGLVLFLPVGGAAQIMESAAPIASAETPQVIRFTDGGDDSAFRITTDAAGNFYIAASLSDSEFLPNSFAVIKYSVNGNLLGVFRFKTNAGIASTVAVDAKGNIYAGGSSAQGGVLVSFSPSGKLRWSKIIGDAVSAVALDQSGNVYAGGTINQASMFVAKFTAEGSFLWQTAHQGSTPAPCGDNGLTPGSCLSDMHLDSNGNVIAFGYSTNAGPNTDNTTLKISPTGNLLWARNFTRQPQFNKVPAAGAVDHDNGIYATGQGVDPFTGQRFPYTVKYDTNGNRIFAFTGAGIGGSSIAVDPSGNILLSGFTLTQGEDAMTVSKIEPSGTQIFVTTIPTGGKVVSDSQGNAFVSGEDGSNDYVVSKVDPMGTLLWTFTFATQTVAGGVADSVVDPFGNLLVTGEGVPLSGGGDEILTLKFPKSFLP
jgi:hypothetical protein